MKWKKTNKSKRKERGEEVRGELIQEEVKAELRILREAEGEGGGEREVEEFRRGCSRGKIFNINICLNICVIRLF